MLRGEQGGLEKCIFWDPSQKKISLSDLEGFDAVIHLSGENIASGRWTEKKKKRIRKSRILSTHLLTEALVQLSKPPQVFISASATGYYGNQGNEILNERSPRGEGFLASLCEQWEDAANPAHRKIRVVHPRFGIILASQGGALEKMTRPFRWGLGAVLGKGNQYLSWIAMEDVVRGMEHILKTESLEGPVNFVSAQPVTQKEFAKTLGKVLRRPVLFSVPETVLKLVLGEMAEELLLTSVRAMPEKLLKSGFQFHAPQLESTLKSLS